MKANEIIAKIAYLKWQDAGCPVSDGKEFWYQAEQEFLQKIDRSQLREYMAFINPHEDVGELIRFCQRWNIGSKFIKWVEKWMQV
jgi:hypothetical protein